MLGPQPVQGTVLGTLGLSSQFPRGSHETRAFAVQGHPAIEEQRKAQSLVLLPSEPTRFSVTTQFPTCWVTLRKLLHPWASVSPHVREELAEISSKSDNPGS